MTTKGIVGHETPGPEEEELSPFEMAEGLQAQFAFKTMNDTREIYYYRDGRFVPKGERLIEIECAKVSPDVKTRVVNEVIEIIRRLTPADRDEFDKDIFV